MKLMFKFTLKSSKEEVTYESSKLSSELMSIYFVDVTF